MNSSRLRRPAPATVVSIVALVAATGGTGYAATKISRDSVASPQVKNGSITGRDVKDGSLGTADLSAKARSALSGGGGAAGPTGPAGPIGPKGDQGPKGDRGADGAAGSDGATGARGPSNAYEKFRNSGPNNVANGTSATVETLELSPGAYAVTGQAGIGIVSGGSPTPSAGDFDSVKCTLNVAGDTQTANGMTRFLFPYSETLSPTLTHTVPAGATHTAVLSCSSAVYRWSASDTKIVAIRVDSEAHSGS